MNKKVVIVGKGVVGENMGKLFPNADFIDPDRGLPYPQVSGIEPLWDIAFICVPTPLTEETGECDTHIVDSAITMIFDFVKTIVIKSTVPPYFTNKMIGLMGKQIMFSPEFFGGTQHANAVDYDFVILGTQDKSCASIVADLYKETKTGYFQIHITDPTTAELVKYAENSFLATKVTFFNEFYRVAQAMNVNVDEFRELLLLDPRIGRSHTFVYPDHPYYDSHCLNKDIPAIIYSAKKHGYDMTLLKEVFLTNTVFKRTHEHEVKAASSANELIRSKLHR